MRELIEAQRARSAGFRETGLLLSPWAHASQVVRSQVFCKKAEVEIQ